MADWLATAGEKSFSCLFCFIFSSVNYNEHAVKGQKNIWSLAEEKDFWLLCEEKAIADLLDKCVTSAGVSRPF